jgi:multidrug efflux pump subunit AcrA (membrane-fusion protein)
MGNSGVVAANRVRVSFLEAQKQAIGSLAEINREIESMNAAERQREDARKRAYDPFGAKQQMAGANDPGTFNALLETQQNRDMAILLKKKAAIEEIDKKIAGLNQTIKVYGQVSDTNFMKAQRASERMLGIAGGFIGGKVEGAAIVPDKNTGDTVAGMGMAQEEKNAREKPLYDNDGMMSLAFQQMGILKQESDKIIEVMKNQESAKQKYMEGLTKQALAEEKRLELTKTYKGDIAEVDTQMQLYNATREHGLTIGDTEYKLIEQQIRAQKEAANGIIKLEEARKKELEQTKRAEEAHKQWAQSMTYAFKDAIMNSKNLGDALSNLANKVQNMLVNKALDSLLGGLFSGFAKGDVFSGGRNMAFAAGGVVSRATTFPMSNGGMGLMGEAGPEAIMPLTRTSSGALGVQAVGGNSGGLSIVNQFEINIEGGDKEQNEDAANQVSSAILRIIDDKIVNVILREKRPGGALS